VGDASREVAIDPDVDPDVDVNATSTPWGVKVQPAGQGLELPGNVDVNVDLHLAVDLCDSDVDLVVDRPVGR
jgi:hypothetical protein